MNADMLNRGTEYSHPPPPPLSFFRGGGGGCERPLRSPSGSATGVYIEYRGKTSKNLFKISSETTK